MSQKIDGSAAVGGVVFFSIPEYTVDLLEQAQTALLCLHDIEVVGDQRFMRGVRRQLRGAIIEFERQMPLDAHGRARTMKTEGCPRAPYMGHGLSDEELETMMGNGP